MALTITDTDAGPPQAIAGGRAGYKSVIKTITFDNSYPAGGETLTAGDLGLSTLLYIDASPDDGYVVAYDYGTGKLKAYGSDSGADGPLIEPSSFGTPVTDLSAVVSRVFAIGT